MTEMEIGQERKKRYPTEREKDIILTLKKLKQGTVKEISRKAGVDIATCYKAVGRMRESGLVTEAVPKRENGRYVTCYKLTEMGEKYANGLSHIFS